MYRIIDDKIVAGIAVSVLLSVSLGMLIEHQWKTQPEVAVTPNIDIIKQFFNNIPVEAKAAAVYDMTSKEFLYEKNPEAQLPLASLTKIMTAYVASKNLASDDLVTITAQSVKKEGDTGLRVGDHFKLRDLLRLTLVHSSNDGAAAIAEAFDVSQNNKSATTSFIDEMNKEARGMGLSQTFFVNEDGLDVASSTSGSYGSARDVAVLAANAIKSFPEIFDATAYPSITVSSLEKRKISAKSTNTAINGIPGLIASKTGFTDLAGGNLVVIFDVGPEHPVAAVVLGSSVNGRFEDIQRLVWATLQSFNALSEVSNTAESKVN